jgi:acetoin utilization deacetylase AcuC-like enzyme
MLVVHTPLSSLHAPKHEILSGALVPYFESPARVQLILDSLLADPEARFSDLSQEWTLPELEEDWFLQLIREVHGEEYLSFLRTVYERWVGEGGNPVRLRVSPCGVDELAEHSLCRTPCSRRRFCDMICCSSRRKLR